MLAETAPSASVGTTITDCIHPPPALRMVDVVELAWYLPDPLWGNADRGLGAGDELVGDLERQQWDPDSVGGQQRKRGSLDAL